MAQTIPPEGAGAPQGPIAAEAIQPPADVLALIPADAASHFQAVPVARENGVLIVAMLDAGDVFTIDELQRITGMRVAPVPIAAHELRTAVSRLYPGGADASAGLADSDIATQGIQRQNIVVLGRPAGPSADAPTIILLNEVLERAIEQRASDIHLEPYERESICRFRVDGVLYDWGKFSPDDHVRLLSRVKVLANIDIAEHRLPGDGRFTIQLKGRRWDVRVSTMPSAHGEKGVLRMLPKDSTTLSLGELGMLERERKVFERLVSRPHGMLLVTGPTGSGKTTTLYTALRSVDTVARNVLTIEDPIEYELPRITQIQVQASVGLTFAVGLRHILRQDPDIIMVGEIRDPETLNMAVQAALTGHFVYSTLHCNDAPSAATRALDMGLEPCLFTSSVIGVMAQRLVRRICNDCRTEEPLPAALRERLNITDPEARMYRGSGCQNCRHTGYRGRLGVYELMTMTEPVRDAIQRRAASSEVRRAALQSGMSTLRDDAIRKVLSGVTTLEEVLRAVYVDN